MIGSLTAAALEESGSRRALPLRMESGSRFTWLAERFGRPLQEL